MFDGASREEAAKIGGMDRQTLRDWVIRFNEQGADGLIFLARIVEAIAKKQAIIQQPQLAQSARVSTEQSSNAARQALIFRMFHLRRFMNVIVGLFRIEERGMTTRWTYIAFTALGLHSNAALAVEAAAKRPTIPPPSFLFMDANSDYRQKLREYLEAREKYESEAKAYWSLVAEKRRTRSAKRRNQQLIALEDYVLAQPPVYSGLPKPIDPSGKQEEPPVEKYVPVKADFLNNAAQYFRLVPQLPATEIQYKRAYAKIAFELGLAKDQAVRIYAFEAGGNGTYDVQAGLENHKPGSRAISTAVGYNQLLNANSIGLLAEHGDELISKLKKRSTAADSRSKTLLEKKIEALQSMIEFCRSVPDDWSEHETLAKTPQGIGVHAVLLDVDLGPLLQAQKILNSVLFARKNGLQKVLSAAELEMMNLTGDGNGFDMVTMPEDMRDQVATVNFFQPAGYERNPVAIRNNTVAKLFAATNAIMDRESALQGAKDLATAFVAARKAQR